MKTSRFSLLLISLLAVALFAGGCWQPADTDTVSTPVSQALPSLTPTFTMTPEPPTATPSPLAETEEPENGSEDIIDVGAQIAEATEPAEVAQVEDPTLDPLIQEATDAIIRQTQQFLDQTATAEAAFTNLPTETFTPSGPTAIPTNLPGQTAVPPVVGVDCVHEVRLGQNLYRISLLYGVSIDSIVIASGIVNPQLLAVGQRLVIPGCGTTGAYPPPTSTPKPGETAIPPGGGGFSQRASGGIGTGTGVINGISPTDPNGGYDPRCGVNGAACGSTLPTQPIVTVQPPTGTCRAQHTVVQGDSLFGIATTYGTDVNSLAAANGLTLESVILPGQVLCVP